MDSETIGSNWFILSGKNTESGFPLLNNDPHLSLSQIYAALAYYHDHEAEMNAQIERGARGYEQLKSQAGETPALQTSQ